MKQLMKFGILSLLLLLVIPSINALKYDIVQKDGSITMTMNEEVTFVRDKIIQAMEANRPVLSPIGNKQLKEGETLRFTVSATDPNRDTLFYLIENYPTGASFDLFSNTFSWTPTYNQAGTYYVTFKVSDGSLEASEIVMITVTDVNQRPVLSAIGNKQVTAGSALTFTLSASDPDGDSLSYSATNLPSGASFTAATKTFSWTPTTSQIGDYSVTFKATDTKGGEASETIKITVSGTTGNRAPVLITIGNKQVTAGSALTFTISATDADNDTLTYSVTSTLPSGASFTAATKTFSWTPTTSQKGSYTVTFKVTDGKGGEASETITITVVETDYSQKVKELEDKYDDYEEDYDDYEDDYLKAKESSDESDIKKYKNKLEDLDDDLDDLKDKINDLKNEIKSNKDKISNYNDRLDDLDDLKEDVTNLREDIAYLLSGKTTTTSSTSSTSSSSVSSSTTTKPTTPTVTTENLQTPIAPAEVKTETTSWEDIRLFAWLGAGIVVLLAAIVFLAAILIKR